ncbi:MULTISPECIES: D-alanyl-D-alanine carboxypeptidase family protein [Heyndrickxia]|jgi:D-alanyl-D-alanine carboxypeptidase (penicillin-binding protein 5/6)|uniref:D-alanyl-D-alanine carboxypeptidase family protein n=1 Tax=Heyndrickxia TaxID=2837504 RepID=UPI0007171E00|nr:D-alanyl-D-alanine carboxypeptidase family protein [Heyndrickxia oleronia]NYV66033.1 D-alanyl-D-alanine carboxypeptidase [Bacillus sp. Gen3]OJH18746.1 D-alanyl-D-alanine carboxypeptidase [Bacillus obstructivus]MCI1591470.1 D-alanyl-D-alanine carboxypeptidase [Heyndrickxia oleronia]MCI1612221.1 D-alanyl-D-alanine carboxypeptidase [Heyndrickxia oleronia]MCI1745687.1 D-alanyl-D-alanine carboxypeptidase [Heyndrickxia oleronia]
MKKIFSSIICLLLLTATISLPAFAAEKSTELAADAKSAILIERDTGSILYDKNSHEKLPPASMTKIMTMILIMEALEQNKLSMNEKVRTSEYAASMGGSQIFLETGEEMTVEEMLRGISIGSANDASVAMAEKIAGSEEEFVDMMNKKVKELGLKDTKFQNATGLPEKDHYSSAYDMAMMAKELLRHENITKFTGTYESYLRESTDKKFWLVNTNKLVKFYPGVDGLKTGFTNEAKFCLTATAKKNGMRVVAVVFGAPSTKVRNAQVSKMLDYAFAKYVTHPIYKKGQSLAEVKVSKGDTKKIQALTSEPISVLTKKGEKIESIKKTIKLNENLKAPVKKGDKIGTITIKKDGKVLAKSNLIASKDVKQAGWWKLFKRSFGMFNKTN